jgi:hypothetical protein
MTGIGIGMALGAFAAGWLVDAYGPEHGFWVSVLAGIASALTIALGQGVLAGNKAVTLHPHPVA